MSSVNKSVLTGLLLIAGLLFMGGCGSSETNESVFQGDAHPANWKVTHKTAALQDPATCTECHGADYSGGTSNVACSSCHVNGSPFVLTNCTSCHTAPPSGTVAPNRTGAHNTDTGHFAAQVTLPDGCNTCHAGAGSGTLNHDNGAPNVHFLNAYNAKSGIAVYNADGTCSKVSCHGGQTTPNWLTGTIDVFSQCASCHTIGASAGNPEYNSFWSGEHAFHVNTLGLACVGCHDPYQLAVNHFTSLNTSTMEGPASATIRTDFVHYDSATQTCTFSSCHSTPTETRPW